MFRFGRFALLNRIYLEGDAGGGQGAAAGAGGDGGQGAAQGGQGADAGAGGGQNAGGETDAVPYDRFKTVNEQKAAAEKANADLQKRITELERAGQSETERQAAERADALAAKEAAEARVAELERGQALAERNGWIRDAAIDAKFHSPSNAIGELATETIETERQAKAAVEKLAKSQPHLVQAEQKDPSQMLDRVLKNGKGADDAGDTSKALDPDTFNSLTQDQLVDLQVNQPEVYEASVRRAAAA